MSSTRREKLWTASLVFAAILAALTASRCADWIAEYDNEIISSRTVCGVLLGQLIGLRRGTLMAFILGPFCGLVAGIVDIKAFLMSYETFKTSIDFAGFVPAWGIVLGALVAAYQVRWRSATLVLAVIGFSDFAARWGWAKAYEHGLQQTADLGSISEAFVYVPTAVLLILLTPSRSSGED